MSIPRPAISKVGVTHMRRDATIILLAAVGVMQVTGWMTTGKADWFIQAIQVLYSVCTRLFA